MKKYITEFIGSFFLVLTIGLVVNGNTTALAPIAIGSALMVMVYAGGHISGGHYNPAVTFAVYIRGRIKVPDAIAYLVSQLLGAAAAALMARYLLADAMPKAAVSNPDIVKAIVAEFLGTFALAYVVLNVATSRNNSGNSYYGLAIGFTVTVMAFALGPFSGGAFNPAVAVGAGIMKMAALRDLWLYAVGCFGGGLLAAMVFLMNNPDDK